MKVIRYPEEIGYSETEIQTKLGNDDQVVYVDFVESPSMAEKRFLDALYDAPVTLLYAESLHQPVMTTQYAAWVGKAHAAATLSAFWITGRGLHGNSGSHAAWFELGRSLTLLGKTTLVGRWADSGVKDTVDVLFHRLVTGIRIAQTPEDLAKLVIAAATSRRDEIRRAEKARLERVRYQFQHSVEELIDVMRLRNEDPAPSIERLLNEVLSQKLTTTIVPAKAANYIELSLDIPPQDASPAPSSSRAAEELAIETAQMIEDEKKYDDGGETY